MPTISMFYGIVIQMFYRDHAPPHSHVRYGEHKAVIDGFRGVFASLQDQAQFNQVRLVDGVVTWPGELDLAPDAMHDEIKRNGQWLLA